MNSRTTSSRTTGLEFVHYFPRQIITAVDMLDEQGAILEKLRRHNRMLHGWGVVCGCEVKLKLEAGPWCVSVGPGYLITPWGYEVEIPQAVEFDLAGDWRQPYAPCPQPSPCSPASGTTTGIEKTVYLAACYTECNTRPVRIHPAGCGCDEAACEYSRVRESFELVRLDELPEYHTKAQEADQRWMEALQPWLAGRADPLPQPECLQSPEDSCVVLASITLPDSRQTPISTIDNSVRRICFNTMTLATLIQAHVRPMA